MIEITCDGRPMPNLSGNLLGMDCDDGKGHLVCCDIWDGLTGIALRLEMSDFVERRSNAAVIAINFCVNGRFETSFSSREHVLLKPGDMAVSRYDGIHGTETTSRLPLGYYEGLCLVIDPVQTENWLARHVPAFSIDTPHLVKILLGGGWYRYGEAGPRCEHVFRELYENISYFDTEYLQLKVIELLMLLTRIPCNEQKRVYYSSKQLEVIRHLRDHLLTDRDSYTSLSRLAAEHHISVSHLQKIFKQIYGAPIYRYIKEYRLERASVELLQSTKSVTDIAADAGYDTASKFSECFKKRYGMTPTQYRTANKMSKQDNKTKTE